MTNASPMVQLKLESTNQKAELDFHADAIDARPRNVHSKILYAVRDPNTRPWTYRRPRQPNDPHPTDTGGKNELREVEIRDGRFYNKKALHSGSRGKDLDDPNLLTLDSSGFELVQVPEFNEVSLSLEDFYGGHRVQNEYYPVVVDVVKKHTGAAHAKILSHVVRNAKMMDQKNLPVEPEKDQAHGVFGYAQSIHSDYTKSTALTSFKEAASYPDERHYRSGRFAVLCLWKSICKEPIKNDPLCLLDGRSLVKDDSISGDVFGYGFQTSVYRLDTRNAHQHRWYYFPHMKSDEAIIFKHHDSDPTCRSGNAFHTSFTDPLASPETANTRQSIDLRVLCYFPDHTPNTCPEVGPKPTDEECAQVLAEAITEMARKIHLNLGKWPGLKTKWVVEQVRKGGADAIEAIIQNAVGDEERIFELNDKDDAFKNMVATMLRQNKLFEKALKQSVSQMS
mmetsp:Transcript_26872/g.41156  ORF Transcript_26872/g.41156 Transcript_26872/m.41156 type:complete len:452 (+) Transcript_26872:137-1492(+)